MRSYKYGKRLLSALFSVLLVLGTLPTLALADEAPTGETSDQVTFEKVENNGNGYLFDQKESISAFKDLYVQEGMVRVSILLEEPATLDKYPVTEVASNRSAMTYREQLRNQQYELADRISNQALDGAKLDVVWNITLAGNIISANVPYDKIDQIKVVRGVKDVVIETLYEVDEASKGGDEPNMAVASDMVGGGNAWSNGYTGAGSKVAILDTGIDLTHELFNGDAYEAAITDLETRFGKTVDIMTEDEVMALWPELNIALRVAEGAGVYKNAKVPFGANYASRTLDPSHSSGTGLSEHGSHVAGIAAGNRLIPDGEGGFTESLSAVHTQGEAPDAQLLIMQVFGNSGTTSDSDYMVAVEDAIILGADSVNLSLGSSSLGFTTNSVYQDLLNKLADAVNLVWVNSAGNNYYWTEPSLGDLYEEDVNYATGGSPATYPNTLSVASVDNIGMIGAGFTASGVFVFYNDNQGYGNEPMTTIAGDYDFVLIDGPGVDDNANVGLEGDQFLALGKEAIEGKIAMCFRGTSSFFAKANAAAAQGAAGVVIINNQPGTINMNLTGYEHTIPAVTISQAEGLEIIANSDPLENEAGIPAYTGRITIDAASDPTVVRPDTVEYLTMSDFSSWGTPSDLSLKPEITAPGGNIYSVNGLHWQDGALTGGPGNYELMSGTSMAAPQVSGLVAVLAQYIREEGLAEKTGRTPRQLALSLLMSTAEPVYGESGIYSVMKQGSGLANVDNAINARSYITIDQVLPTAPSSALRSIQDGKVKVELGQVLEDTVTAAFSLHNFSDEEISYYLDADFFTQMVDQGYRLLDVQPLDLALAWTVNGQPFVPGDADRRDFNGDGVANGQDAQHLLDYCAGLTAELNPASEPDMDEDGDVDTHDAYLAFEALNGASVNVPAGEEKQIVLTVSGLSSALGSYVNGNYIEGFISAVEGETGDGALGITHSIPVYGFYGNWTDASMFDQGSYVEFANDLADKASYMFYGAATQAAATAFLTGNSAQGFLVQYPGSSSKFYFGGNPVTEDKTSDGSLAYYPERNALNPSSTITDYQYTLIRNAAARRFYVANAAGKELPRHTLLFPGLAYSAYYYRNQAQWRNTVTTTSLGFSPVGSDGTKQSLNFQAAPEYYVNRGLNWEELGEGSIYSIPYVIDSQEPTIVDVVEGDTLNVIAHDNEYISAVALILEDGTVVHVFGGLENVRRSEQYIYEFALSELFGENPVPDHLLVEVYDYAANLSTYKINFNKEELEGEEIKIDLPAAARVLKGTTLQLTASVTPWGVPEGIVFTSSDERIASVDENGLVTGISKGTVNITATYTEDPSIEAVCEVEVYLIPMTLIGALQDEDGTPILFSWNLETDETWTPVAELPEGFTAMTLDPLDSDYLYLQDWDGFMHKMNLNTLEIEETSESTTAFGIPMEDIALGKVYNTANEAKRIYGVAENYFLYSADGPIANTFNYGLPLSPYGATALMAMAYEPSAEYDYYYILDTSGDIFRMRVSATHAYGLSIFETDLALDYPLLSDYTHGNSMVEGADYNFYLAHFNGSTSEIYQLSYNGTGFSSVRIGDVGNDVWPAVLLGASVNDPAGGNALPAVPEEPAWHQQREADLIPVEEEPVLLEYVNGRYQEVGGGTNAVRTPAQAKTQDPSDAEPQKISTEVSIEVSAEDLAKNGLVVVEYPDTVILKGYESTVQFRAAKEEPGKLTFAFVDLTGILEGEPVLTLRFDKESTGQASVTLLDVNEDDGEGVTEVVAFGPVAHSKHTYNDPVWTWSFTKDEVSATATFVCPLDGDTQTAEAVITEEGGEFIATVLFEEKEYQDIMPVPAAVVEDASGEYTAYKTLRAAIAACENDSVVYLFRDVTEQAGIPAGKEIVLDLYGHTITWSGHAVLVQGKLTLEDSSEEGLGAIVSTGNCGLMLGNSAEAIVNAGSIKAQEAPLFVYGPNAKLTVNDGTFTAVDNFVVGTNGSAGLGGSEIVLNGGTYNGAITSDGYIACGIYAANNDTWTINGGTFQIVGGAGIVARAGQITVNDGVFNVSGTAEGGVGDKKVSLPSAAVVFDTSNPEYPGLTDESSLVINGGVFKSEYEPAVTHLGDDVRTVVSGGYFSSPVDEAYITEGMVCSEETTTISEIEGDFYFIKEAPPVIERLPAVTGIKAVPEGHLRIRLSWDAVEGAAYYIITGYRDGKYAGVIGNTPNTTWLHLEAEPGYNFYWVFAVDKNGIVGLTCQYAVGRAVNTQIQVKNLKAESLPGGVRLTWTVSEGADGYHIMARRSGGQVELIGDTTTGIFIDSEASSTEFTFYWVYAYQIVRGEKVRGSAPPYVFGKAKN